MSESASLELFVFNDNGGGYHWAIVGGSGESLAHSGSFGSYEDASHAGHYARDGAEWARFQGRAAEDRVVDVPDRREDRGLRGTLASASVARIGIPLRVATGCVWGCASECGARARSHAGRDLALIR